MSAKDLLIAHGEKIAVVATVLLCAWEISAVSSDESIRPSGISAAKIQEQNAAIDRVFVEGKAPVLKPVPDYLGAMQARLVRSIAAPECQPWMTAPPDRGPSASGLMAYIYEAPAPVLAVGDGAAGRAVLTIGAAKPQRAAERRLADARSVEWSRTEEGVVNRAEMIGWRLEVRIGDGAWRPFTGSGIVDGLVPLSQVDATGALVVEGLEPWVRHSFRVAPLVKATGVGDGPAAPNRAVLVRPGRLASEDLDWGMLSARLKAADPALSGEYAKPLPFRAPVWAAVQAGEQLYAGGLSEEVAVQVTSDIRFAFDRVAGDDPAKPVAVLLVTRLVPGVDGVGAWLAKPKKVKAAIGQAIAGEVDIQTAKGRQRLRLDTGFEVVEIKRDQKRVLYYEIKKKAKALEVKPKMVSTEVLVVRNQRTKTPMELVRLHDIRLPAVPGAIISPQLAAADLDEGEAFGRRPGEFRQVPLIPAAPVMHAPGTGPLAKLRAEHPAEASFYETNTDYAELSDGRIVWYEPVNDKLRQWPEPVAAK